MATKHGGMMAYSKLLPPIKLLDPLVTWSRKITPQTETILSHLLRCLWSPNLAGWWITLRGSYPYTHINFYSRCLTRSRDERKTYFYYHNTCGHQTWHCDDIHNVIRSFHVEVSWGLGKNWIFYISTCTGQWSPNMTRWWLTVRSFYP